MAIRIVDVAVSALVLAVTAPIMALVALLIKLESPGPAIFRQERIGLGGRPFVIYKFRTMWGSDAERPRVGPVRDFRTYVFSVPGDERRLTRLGRVLRRTSIDELPNLWNVLRGEMSLVGPRPELPEVVAQYPPAYHRRHTVPPGVTGLAQVSGRGTLTYDETMQYDLAYVDRRSLALNLRILLKTVGAVVTGRGWR